MAHMCNWLSLSNRTWSMDVNLLDDVINLALLVADGVWKNLTVVTNPLRFNPAVNLHNHVVRGSPSLKSFNEPDSAHTLANVLVNMSGFQRKPATDFAPLLDAFLDLIVDVAVNQEVAPVNGSVNLHIVSLVVKVASNGDFPAQTTLGGRNGVEAVPAHLLDLFANLNSTLSDEVRVVSREGNFNGHGNQTSS